MGRSGERWLNVADARPSCADDDPVPRFAAGYVRIDLARRYWRGPGVSSGDKLSRSASPRS